MFMDALKWNILNIIRVELFLDCYKLWDIYLHASINSPRGQYAIASFIITLLAQLTVQFDLHWLLNVYLVYLLTGACVWIHRRVYFYHRRLDSLGINQTINHFESNKHAAANNHHSNGLHPETYATLSKKSNKDHHNHQTNATGGSSSAASSSANSATSSSAGSNSSEHTNSLQRQRALAYRDFRSLLVEPRRNHKDFAISLAHLSNISKLVADKDVFDEMHFQILATRRDVVNILLRAILIIASSLLAYM